ncbi:MAG: hypothetical protein ACT4ON_11140 [Bacteroidota bacterium]
MKLLELFQDDIIRLPIYQTEKSPSFRKELFDRLDIYKSKIDLLDFSELTGIFSPTSEKALVANLIDGIKKSIDLYLDGYPFESYTELKNSLNMGIFSHFSNNTLDTGQCVFRLRRQSGNYPLSQKELFHIPFHSRIKVDTQRYSIPGFPSLYAANSIYVAWEELGRLPIEELQAAKLNAIHPISFFDLTTDIYLDGVDLSAKDPIDLWKHLIIWPLIASCSIKVKDRKAPFKPEYIIPQLMLQIIRAEKKWDGIRFSSTHIDRNIMKKAQGTFYNYVLPVKDNKDSGYCDELCKMFQMSDVLSWQIAEVFLKPSGTAIIAAGVDNTPYQVQTIELIPDKPLAYQYSVFGNLEKMLNSNPTTLISVI